MASGICIATYHATNDKGPYQGHYLGPGVVEAIVNAMSEKTCLGSFVAPIAARVSSDVQN